MTHQKQQQHSFLSCCPGVCVTIIHFQDCTVLPVLTVMSDSWFCLSKTVVPTSNLLPQFPTRVCFLLPGDTSDGLTALVSVQAGLAALAAAPVSSGKPREEHIDSANSF